jgi:hypothetical protein
MIVGKYGNYVRKCVWQLCVRCVYDRFDISLTVHSRTIFKIVKSTCNDKEKIECTLMKCHANVDSTLHPHSCDINVRT